MRRKQKRPFKFVFDPTLLPYQVITDKRIISGGVIRLKYTWLDVVRTKKNIGNVIYCGDRTCMFGEKVHVKEIVEEAVG